MYADTIDALRRTIDASGLSYRKLAKQLDLPYMLLFDVAHERHTHVSAEAENRLRLALGLEAVHLFPVPACPDCGSVHHVRCNGVPDPVVVCRPPRKSRRFPTGKSISRLPDDLYSLLNTERLAVGLTWPDYLRRMHDGE